MHIGSLLLRAARPVPFIGILCIFYHVVHSSNYRRYQCQQWNNHKDIVLEILKVKFRRHLFQRGSQQSNGCLYIIAVHGLYRGVHIA